MSEQTPNNGQAEQPAFNAHDYVSEMLGGVRTSLGPQDNIANDANTVQEIPPVEGQSPATAAPPPSEPAPPQVDYEAQLKQAHKTINGIQSTLDKRIAASNKPLLDRIDQLTNTVGQLMSRLQQPAQTDDYGAEQPQQLNPAHIQQLVQRELEQRLNSDPRVQAGSVIGDWARFRAERPDSFKYDMFTQKVLERMPAPPGQLYAHLSAIGDLVEDLLGMQANTQAEAPRTPQPQPTQPQGQPQLGRIDAGTAAALASKAASYRQEMGQSAVNPAKPVINYRGSLDQAIEQMADAYAKKYGGGNR